MTKDKTLRLALEAFGKIDWSNNSQWQSDRAKVAIASLKEALAQPEQPKVRTGNCLRVGVCASEGHKIQPQRTWVGLTAEEIEASKPTRSNDAVVWELAVEWAEAKLKELNS